MVVQGSALDDSVEPSGKSADEYRSSATLPHLAGIKLASLSNFSGDRIEKVHASLHSLASD